jgi:ComF family protein
LLFAQLYRWPQQRLGRILAGLPSCCALCGTTGAHLICGGCRQHYFTKGPPRCRQCANPTLLASTLCGICLKQPRAFDNTIAVIDYAAPIDQLVLALKFGGRLALAPLFAEMLARAAQQQVMAGSGDTVLPELLTAVPLSASRLQQRGFNQALEIAKPLARILKLPLQHDLLRRQRDTLPQSHGLDLLQRRRNLRRAFIVQPEAIKQIRGCHVGVVDDVMTTGETLNEFARTLRSAGASRVTNLVFARTP